MNHSDIQRLRHIRRYCEDIASFIERFGKNFGQHRTIHGTHLACIIFRHIAQKSSAIHKVFPQIFGQSDENSDCAICAPELCGVAFEAFTEDRAYSNAVSMCILQIGELANGLSDEFREETKEEMPWGMIRGMRNWLAHAYAEMDESTIWETATNDIPGLLAFCNRVIDKMPKDVRL